MGAYSIVVDTDIIVDYLRRRQRTLEVALRRHACAMTSITWYELNALPTRSSRQGQLMLSLRQVMSILPFDETAATHAAAIWRDLQRTGQPIGLPDTLIAGICRAYALPILTRNIAHYGRVPGLQVITPEMLMSK